MATPKRVPVEVLERARTVVIEKQVIAAPPAPAATAKLLPRKVSREKVIEALKRLHPMD